MSSYLTKKKYFEFAEKHKNEPHWAGAKIRWSYHKAALDILTHHPAKKILEAGTMGMNLWDHSDTIDLNLEDRTWPLYYKPTYNHDLRITPWPIEDNKYDVFIALRVFHHMLDKAEECFKEMCRISEFIILVLPEYAANIYKKIRKPSYEIGNLGFMNGDDTVLLYYDVHFHRYSSKIERGNNLVSKHITGNSVKEFINREVFWLNKLAPYDIVPRLVTYTDDTIITEYCGKSVTMEQWKDPKIQKQLIRIIKILLENNCFYNDFSPNNFLLLNGKIRIIDFEWCPMVKEDFSCDNSFDSKIVRKIYGNEYQLLDMIYNIM